MNASLMKEVIVIEIYLAGEPIALRACEIRVGVS